MGVANVHPRYLCNKCERVLARGMCGAKHCGGGCGPVRSWVPHHETHCQLCEEPPKKPKAGRPPKRKYQPRGKLAEWHSRTMPQTAEEQTSTAGNTTPSHDPSTSHASAPTLSRLPQTSSSQMHTSDSPQTVSSSNSSKEVHSTSVTVSNANDTIAASPVEYKHISNSSTVSQVLESSPSKLQGDTASKLMAHLVKARTVNRTLEVKSSQRGRPVVYHQTSAGEVSSSVASERTKRRRKAELDSVSSSVCVGSGGAHAQAVSSLQSMASSERDTLLREAGLTPSTPLPGTALAIKADLQLPWSQLRKLKVWLTKFGVQLESEHTIRRNLKSDLPPYTAQQVPMVQKNGDISMVAVVYFPHLMSVVEHYLSLYNARGLLTWHGSFQKTRSGLS